MHVSALGWLHIALSIAVLPVLALALRFWLRGETSSRLDVALFVVLALTVLTGFCLPAHAFGPAHVLGIAAGTALIGAVSFARSSRGERAARLAVVLFLFGASAVDVVAGVVAAFQFVPPLTSFEPAVPAHLSFGDILPSFENVELSASLLACVSVWAAVSVRLIARWRSTS